MKRTEADSFKGGLREKKKRKKSTIIPPLTKIRLKFLFFFSFPPVSKEVTCLTLTAILKIF